jgi:UDP-2,3-diacylglucosamine pyrophosphatase LpxH
MSKFKFVVSDLHLGAGYQAEGNALEDFGSDRDMADLLDRIVAESQRKGAEVELIVNGDAFEMLQVPNVEGFDPSYTYAPEQYHSSSEDDSVLKIAIIISGHPVFFDALKRFVQLGPPRRVVTFVKGNHDLNLHWPAVQWQIRQAMGAVGEKAVLLGFEERLISREGICVEHGNQYAEAVDRVRDMEEPHDHDKPGQLALPLGSWFVMDVLNDVEREKYWIDGVKPITALMWYALAFDFPFAARAISTLIRRLPGIIEEGLFEVSDRRADALARLLENPDRVRDAAVRYEQDETFRREFNAEVTRAVAPPAAVAAMDVPRLAAVADPVIMGDQIRSRVHSLLFDAARRRAEEEGVRLVIFGHTHDPRAEDLPDGGTYINSGTWTWRTDFAGATREKWQELFEHPEWFVGERTLSYVRIDYDEGGQPEGCLLRYKPGDLPTPAPPAPVPAPSPEASTSFMNWLRRFWAHLVGRA